MSEQSSLYIMAAFYGLAGVNYFFNPKFYLKIIPSWLPYHHAINFLSGALEILFAVLLIPDNTRSTAAWMLIGLLIAVFPANIQMSLNYYRHKRRGFWLTIMRLPLQGVLIWWAWQFTK